MKGFKMICMNCGKETINTQGDGKWIRDNENISIAFGDKEIAIYCKCFLEISTLCKGVNNES